MRIKILLLLCVFVLSCAEKRPSNGQVIEQTANLVVTDLSEEDIKTLLYSYEKELVTKWKEKISFIRKINFGILGGDNWIVEWSYDGENTGGLVFYLIKDNEVKKHYSVIGNSEMQSYSRFDIMADIPGIHIGSGTCSLGDFNGDGIDEIFEYGFYGYGNTVHIWGYDVTKDDLVVYCDIPFRIIDTENGPAPVEFITYKGVDGFKVYYAETVVAGGLGYIPEVPPDNDKWFFYTWDEMQREYMKIEEIEE